MRNIYRETFDQIRASEQLREEVRKMTKQEHITTVKRRIPKTALIAAALALVLAGTALAVASPTLREWFEQKWAEETGSQLKESQSLVIDSLTQKVGISDTSGEVTVTVDSITVGTSQIWALLDVEGWDFDRNAQYSFDRMRVEIVPDPSEGQYGGAGYGLDSIGFTEDGRCRMLLELTPESLSPVITIDRVQLPSNQMAWDQTDDEDGGTAEGTEPRPAVATLTDLQITATEVSFYCDGLMDRTRATAILADGTEVEDHGRGGSRMEDGSWYVSFDWPVPLDVTDIIAIRFGDTEIPLN